MKSLVVTLTAAAIISSTAVVAEARPARPAPRPEPRTDVVQTIRAFMSKIGGIFTLSMPTIPLPGPETKTSSTSPSYATSDPATTLPSGN
ncbi:MAG: hypothetical protein M3Q69_08195 [Acidobacteriota bacterium]|nr:hypothetical protein [Acidobacteriota bacterium]